MFQTVYIGVIAYEKFIGVKSGRSCWKTVHLRLRPFYNRNEAYSELRYFVEDIIPCMGVKLVGYHVESELTDIMDSPCHGCNAPKQCCPCK